MFIDLLFASPLLPVMAGLQCLCLTQALIHTKPELKGDGRRSQLNSPQAGASNLHATRTFIYPFISTNLALSCAKAGPRNRSLNFLQLINYTCAHHEKLLGQKKTNVKRVKFDIKHSTFLSLLESHLQVLCNLSKSLSVFLNLLTLVIAC